MPRLSSPSSSKAPSEADELRRLKYRKWYERKLIHGHMWMVTGLLCLILLCVCIEWVGDVSRRGSGDDRWAGLLLALASGAATLWSWKRYQQIILVAELVAEQAICPQCKTDGFQCVNDDATTSAVRARCRKCGHEWRVYANELERH